MREARGAVPVPPAGGPRVLRRCAGLALLAAGQLTGWIALVFAAWSRRAGGNSYQTGRVGTVAERLVPLLFLLAAAGTALAAGWTARRDGQPRVPWMAAAVLLAAAVAAVNHATEWRLLGAAVHPLRPLLGEPAVAAAAAVEMALGAWLLRAGRTPWPGAARASRPRTG